MVAQVAPERDFRTAGCDARCTIEHVLRPGVFGRSDLLRHDPEAHEAYGRRQGALHGAADIGQVETGPLVVDVLRAAVTIGGRTATLSPSELRVLLALATEPGLVVPYAKIADAGWGAGSLDLPRRVWMHALRSTVCRLRGRLRPAGGLVQSVRDLGLRLVMIPTDGVIPPVPDPRAARILGRWARDWERCRICARIDRAHNGRGYCTACHARVLREIARSAR